MTQVHSIKTSTRNGPRLEVPTVSDNVCGVRDKNHGRGECRGTTALINDGVVDGGDVFSNKDWCIFSHSSDGTIVYLYTIGVSMEQDRFVSSRRFSTARMRVW